jgi:hypothetical protein
MEWEYQRRTQKGIVRNEKFPEDPGTKTQRLCAAGAGSAKYMVRFFSISTQIDFERNSLTVQSK